MAFIDRRARRVVAAVVAAGLALSACNPTPVPSVSPPASTPLVDVTSPPAPRAGGTIYILTQAEQLNYLDPQRVYTQEDSAFLGATLLRSLVSFAYSADPIEGTTLVPDLATDLGRPTDGGRTWSFTLREGVTFQTGDPITCEDIKYGVSRTFASNLISEGPTYAIEYLDIPGPTKADQKKGFLSAYRGPYESTSKQHALFDSAVECSPDHRTITFNLNRTVGDFNAVTTLGFSPVPRAADTRETYGTGTGEPISSGPYMVERYTIGHGGKFLLVRNPNWNPASDPIRKAYPDRWEVQFTLDPKEIDARLMASEGEDAFALLYGQVQPENLATVFADPETPNDAYASRAISGFDPYARYYWINVERVPNLKVRQAMLVALDRQSIREILGGPFWASYADGAIKPSIGRDYAPTGIWDGYFGQPIPATGDPELARRLLLESGAPPEFVTFTAASTPTNQRAANAVVGALAQAGMTVKVDLIEPGCGYGPCTPYQWETADFGTGAWAADWPNASTVIPPLFAEPGDWNRSHVDDASFDRAADDAFATLDRSLQAQKWQALNRQAVENAWIIPTFFGQSQVLAGTRVGPIYKWPAYVSWPYGVMHVTN